jgi:hypothetical protein
VKHKSILILGILAPALAMGITRHVYEADGARGIQDSIYASLPYDVILVHPGTYYVGDVSLMGIRMKDTLTLVSADGAESCILSGSNSTGTDTAYLVIYCYFEDSSSHEAVIRGFTIKNGSSSPSGYQYGGGICCDESSPLIDSCIITSNSARHGAGLYLSLSSSVVRHNTITGNCVAA